MGTQPQNTHGIHIQTQPIPEFGFGYYPWVPEFWVPNPRSSMDQLKTSLTVHIVCRYATRTFLEIPPCAHFYY
jgi:hypothetical protein